LSGVFLAIRVSLRVTGRPGTAKMPPPWPAVLPVTWLKFSTRLLAPGRPCRRCRPCSPPSHIVDRNGGKTDSRRALRACAGSRRSRRGRPVLQAPVLGAANIKRRNCPGFRGLLFEVPEAPISAAAGMQLTQLHGEPKSTLVESVHARRIYPRLLSLADTSYPGCYTRSARPTRSCMFCGTGSLASERVRWGGWGSNLGFRICDWLQNLATHSPDVAHRPRSGHGHSRVAEVQSAGLAWLRYPSQSWATSPAACKSRWPTSLRCARSLAGDHWCRRRVDTDTPA
jgi:hypothetical protein